MIRILTYKEHPRGKAIWDCYLYLAAYVLPFSPEDVLGNDELEVGGTIITAGNFLQKSQKRARRRTANYLKLLKQVNILDTPYSREQRLEQDQLMAARLIQSASRKLYGYLYAVEDVEAEPAAPPRVRRENLRMLLTVKMDELPKDLKAVGTIDTEHSQKLQEEIFRYESFSGNSLAVKLLELIDANVCPYCNRMYTVTLTGEDGNSRPQFDHYKSKSKYPYFAVSLMNLIPSCGLCNQSKGDQEGGLYPYSDELGTKAVFRTKAEKGLRYLTGCQDAQNEFSVALEIVDQNLSSELRDKITQSQKLFHLAPLYNKHKDYVLYLFWKNYVFNDEYLQILCDEFPEAFHSLQDVKSMMYLMDLDPAQWGRRPLAKLTHDIDREINEMTKLF